MNHEFPSMWDYWRDKKGVVVALEDQYPETLASTPVLQAALYQIKAGEALIETWMNSHGDDDDET